jgi:tRNA 2-(methylsulfanyl)-N6-isopentenyladenosine37 hydroxylase
MSRLSTAPPIQLKLRTSPLWIEAVLHDFDSFLQDHANCERKASGSAMNMASHYPDRTELVSAMIDLAREELQHFSLVYSHMAARGVRLAPDRKDPYARRLSQEYRKGSEEYFLDRLLVAGILEARGGERFGLIASALNPGPLKTFYADIARSEARHQGL